MAGACPTPASGSNFIGTTLAHFDCQAKNIGADGYQALAGAGSPLSIALTAALTLYVAIIGFRMLRGQLPNINDLTVSALKIGLVLALATGWASSRGDVYDAVLRAPAELSGSIGGAAALPGTTGGLNSRLQAADEAITMLISVGSGRYELITFANGDPRLRNAAPIFNDDLALGLGRTAFIASLFAGFGFLRLFGGLLLAMVPFFAAFLLFGQMRWLFMGWLRSMIAVFLGSLFAAVIVGVELAILEPWLVNVLAQRAALRPAIEAPFEFFALTLSFAIILFSTLTATTWLCFSTNVTVWVEQRVEQWRSSAEAGWAERQVVSLSDRGNEPALSVANRGLAIARSVAMVEQRAGQAANQVQPISDRRTPPLDPVDNRARASLEVTPLGQSYKRTARRVSASATRRSATT